MEYVVTEKGGQNFVNGRMRSPGSLVPCRPDNAAYYLEMGWIEEVKPKRSTRKATDGAEIHND